MEEWNQVERKCWELRDSVERLTNEVKGARQDRLEHKGRYLRPHPPAREIGRISSGEKNREQRTDRYYDRENICQALLFDPCSDRPISVLTDKNRSPCSLPHTPRSSTPSSPISCPLLEARLRLLETTKNNLLTENLEMETKLAVVELERNRAVKERKRLEGRIGEVEREKEELSRALEEEKEKAERWRREAEALRCHSEKRPLKKIEALQEDLTLLSKEREMLMQTFSNYPPLQDLCETGSRGSSPSKQTSSRLQTERNSESDALSTIAAMLETSPSALLPALKHLKSQCKVYSNFYHKVHSLVQDCSLGLSFDIKQVFSYVKRCIEDSLSLKLTFREEHALVQDAMAAFRLSTPQAAIQTLYSLLPGERSDCEKMSTGLSFSQSLD